MRLIANFQNDDDYVRKIDEACKKFDKKGTGYISEIDIISILGYVNLSCQHKKVVPSKSTSNKNNVDSSGFCNMFSFTKK